MIVSGAEADRIAADCGRYGDPADLQSLMDAAKGGSYRAVRMFLLTRREPGGRVELIRALEY